VFLAGLRKGNVGQRYPSADSGKVQVGQWTGIPATVIKKRRDHLLMGKIEERQKRIERLYKKMRCPVRIDCEECYHCTGPDFGLKKCLALKHYVKTGSTNDF